MLNRIEHQPMMDTAATVECAAVSAVAVDSGAGAVLSPGCRVDRAMPMRTGHHRQPDGSVLRVDYEAGHWVGSLYTPELELKTQVIGSDREVHDWADRIAV